MTNKHTALRLVETRSLARDEWLEVRKKGIGSSDAAAAIGLSPYKSQLELWMEKTGRSPGFQPSGQDDPTYWGTSWVVPMSRSWSARRQASLDHGFGGTAFPSTCSCRFSTNWP